jgi:hypothetical protein
MATALRDQESSRTQEAPFGVNEMRLNARQWLAVAAIVLAFVVAVPRAWKRVERFDTGPDYRIPYALSSDYWLYQRRVDALADTSTVPVFGDSVVWGEYVRPDGTLTHFLNACAGGRVRFANCGVNGVFPLAMEGLIAHYAGSLRGRKVIVHCNALWMSSPKADLSTREEETFNHPALVPQGFGRVPCYRADAATRLGYIAQRNLGFFAWVHHADDVYYNQMSVPKWTLAQDDSDPPRCPNAWRNPLSRITMRVPGEPADDPQRGPSSPRHRPWNARGARPTHFDWVSLGASLQWQALQRTILLLRERGNDVLVILGPFNEHMVAEDQRPAYRTIRDRVAAWLESKRIARVVPETLPSDLYADASHPLTQGYAELSRRIWSDPVFQQWLNDRRVQP